MHKHRMNLTMKPIYYEFHATGSVFDERHHPNMRELSRQFAEYILQNGFIVQHGPYLNPSADSSRYTFTMYIYKPDTELP